jgi:peptidoglycan/xylan/chitin deacetylase (PgdA/CDA1 family)
MKQLVLRILHGLRFWHFLLWLESHLSFRRSHLVVLCYHHISEGENAGALSQLEAGTSQKSFDLQLRHFSRWYTPVRMSQVAAVVHGAERLCRDNFAVTLDDGYLDNRQLAGPCLRKYGIHGVVFLPTDFIDGRRHFWWVRLNDLLRAAGLETDQRIRSYLATYAELEQLSRAFALTDVAARRALRESLAKFIERLEVPRQEQFLDGLENITGRPAVSCLPLLTWEDAAAMIGEGFEYGSHTRSHPHMTMLSSSANREETVEGVRTLAARTGTTPIAFAYPYGDCDDRVARDVREVGASLAFTLQPGVFVPGTCDPMRIPRLQVYWSHAHELLPVIFCIKMTKYFPLLFGRLLTHAFGATFMTRDTREAGSSKGTGRSAIPAM